MMNNKNHIDSAERIFQTNEEDQVLTAFDFKPLDTNELDDDDIAAIKRAKEDIREGRMVSWEDIQREFK